MNAEHVILGMRAEKVPGREVRERLAAYLASLPRSKRVFHRWMKGLEAMGMAVIAATFGMALYVSIRHTTVSPTAILMAWLALPVSAVPLSLFTGIHTLGLRASLPGVPLGKKRPFVTGSRAVGLGWGTIVTALAIGTFWGGLAWAIWSSNLSAIAAYVRVLATAIAVTIVVSMVLSVYRHIIRAH